MRRAQQARRSVQHDVETECPLPATSHQLLRLGPITIKQTHIVRHIEPKRFQAILQAQLGRTVQAIQRYPLGLPTKRHALSLHAEDHLVEVSLCW